MTEQEKKLKAEQAWIQEKKLFDSSTGTLVKNAILEKMWNKIAFQKTIRTFNYDGLNAIKRYFNSSQLVGGIDELVNVGMAQRTDFVINDDWYKERFYPDANAEWSVKLYEDKYLYSTSYQKMAQAFIGMQQYGSFLTEMRDSIAQQKASTWYDRMIKLWQESKNYVEIELTVGNISELTGDELGKLITGIARKMTLPNTSYNKFGRKNATPFAKQNLVMDADAATTVDWDTAKIFNRNGIDGMGKLLSTDYVKFDDGRTIAIIDTNDKFFIKEKYVLPGMQPIIANKYANMYLHEEYNFADLPWVDGVRIVLKGASPKPTTKPLSDDLKVVDLGELGDNKNATILNAVKAKNKNVNIGECEVKDITDTTANINSKSSSTVYTGNVAVSFTVKAPAKTVKATAKNAEATAKNAEATAKNAKNTQ